MEIYFMPDKGSGSRSGSKKLSQDTKNKHVAKGKGAAALDAKVAAVAPAAPEAGKTGKSGAAGGGGHRGR